MKKLWLVLLKILQWLTSCISIQHILCIFSKSCQPLTHQRWVNLCQLYPKPGQYFNSKQKKMFKGVGVGKIDIFFTELTPRLWTYELRGQVGKKKEKYKIKTNKHLTLSYKNYLQNCHTPPKLSLSKRGQASFLLNYSHFLHSVDGVGK